MLGETFFETSVLKLPYDSITFFCIFLVVASLFSWDRLNLGEKEKLKVIWHQHDEHVVGNETGYYLFW
jgi:hypothetical protein